MDTDMILTLIILLMLAAGIQFLNGNERDNTELHARNRYNKTLEADETDIL